MAACAPDFGLTKTNFLVNINHDTDAVGIPFMGSRLRLLLHANGKVEVVTGFIDITYSGRRRLLANVAIDANRRACRLILKSPEVLRFFQLPMLLRKQASLKTLSSFMGNTKRSWR